MAQNANALCAQLNWNATVTFPGSMHIVFHLQFNLPSSFFFSLCQFLTHPDCTFAAEITITLYIIRYEGRKKEGVESLKCEI